MNAVELVAKTKVSYSGVTNSILKYMSMRNRMNKPVVTADQIMNFFPNKITRRDSLLRNLRRMVINGCIEQKDDGYFITNLGKQVPFVVASAHVQNLMRSGKRVNYANCPED